MKFAIVFDDPLKERMERFRANISKQVPTYDKLRRVVRKQFAEVIKEEITKCISCGAEFVGKSIGPHYKNSPTCAAFKKEKKKEGMNEEPREPKEPRIPLAAVEPNIQRPEPIPSQVKQQAIYESDPIYDEVNEYFV